jgi:hypothetical protein
VFIVIGMWLSLPSFVMGLWFLGLLSHFGASLPAMRRVFGDGLASGVGRLAGNETLLQPAYGPPAATETQDVEPEPTPATPSVDPLSEQLSAEWVRLEALRESLDEAGGAQLDEARAALDEVLARRSVVKAHLEGEDEESLAQEAAELETEVAGAPDARTREVLEQALGALQARRAAVGELRRADVRLGARARATLHQLKSIRMSLVSSDSGPGRSGRTALSALTEALRQEARSSAELDEALAGARNRPAEAVSASVRATRETP